MDFLYEMIHYQYSFLLLSRSYSLFQLIYFRLFLFGFFSTNQSVILWFVESSLNFDLFDLLFVSSLSINGSNALNDFFLFLFIIPSSFDAVSINNAFISFWKNSVLNATGLKHPQTPLLSYLLLDPYDFFLLMNEL